MVIFMANKQVHSTAVLRRANRNRVYRCLYSADEPVTKQDLARILSMSLPTLTQNLGELLELGLIDNSEIADSTGGRKPRILTVVPGARFALGAELSPHHVRVVAVDMCLQELAYQVLDRSFRADDEYALALAGDLEQFINENKLDRACLLGVGIALPGIIDRGQRTIRCAPTLSVKDMDTDILTRHIPYPVFLTNDANAGGFAEWWNRTGLDNIAYLSLGRGVGGAILINGAPYEGRHQRSGEFGHMCIHPGGRVCHCGKQGCLEAHCSTARLSDDLGISLEEFFSALDGGEEGYVRVWEAYLDDLAIGIANIYTALDCDIVLGGILTQFLIDRVAPLESRLSALAPFWEAGGHLHLCRYHNKSNSIGAALHFVDEFLTAI